MAESIYKFVQEPKPPKPKKEIYKSKYDPKGPLIGSTFCMQGTTVVDGKGFHSLKKDHVVSTSFGSQPEQPDPKHFLQKGTRKCRDEARIPSVEHHNREKDVHKPPIPSRDDNPAKVSKSSKDYVYCNAIEVINSIPGKRKEIELPYWEREDYGKVPAYLETVKSEIEQEKKLVDKYISEQFGNEGHQEQEVMDEVERRELFNKLKQRWGEVNTEYQKYCHKAPDTPGDIRRKAAQEEELKQLEDDLEMLGRPGPLVITK
ncbi:hypothetical protein ACHAWU_009820 [Discostella pseudostelligera]|uniref:Enkurin domain-containing protein n=1 Tax=Discostella pseudostelligera TaxID=259834 RepID=A0ABD3M7G5_9STRA